MDGSKVAISVLPLRYARVFARMERYGIFPLLLLLLIPETNRLIGRVIDPVAGALIDLFLKGPAAFF
jgi:Zn-dependent protease